MSSGFGGYATVFCAAFVAPIKNKAVPAITMAIIMAMLYGVAILSNIVSHEWLRLVQCIVAVIAGAVAMFHQIEETREARRR